VAFSGDRDLTVLWAARGRLRLNRHLLGGASSEVDIPLPSTPIHALALSPSGHRAVLACEDGTLRILDTGRDRYG